MKTLQICGAKAAGGAEAFFLRFVAALSEKAETVIVVRDKSWIADQLDARNLPFFPLPFGGALDFRTGKLLRRILRETRPDLVQAWLNRANSALPGLDIPSVGRLGGYYALKHYRKRTHLVGNTEDIRQYLIKEGWPDDKCSTIGNFVTIPETTRPEILARERRGTRMAFGIPEDACLLFTAGRLHENKAFDTALEALAELPERYWLVIAGEGPEEEALRTLAEQRGLIERCRFAGWVNPITPLCQAADLFLVPSRHEPLGNVVLDGWAHRMPVIAATSQGPRQLMTDGENGLLFPIDEPTPLANAIRRLDEDPALARSLADNGFDTLQAEHGQDQVIEAYLQLYRSLTGRKD